MADINLLKPLDNSAEHQGGRERDLRENEHRGWAMAPFPVHPPFSAVTGLLGVAGIWESTQASQGPVPEWNTETQRCERTSSAPQGPVVEDPELGWESLDSRVPDEHQGTGTHLPPMSCPQIG